MLRNLTLLFGYISCVTLAQILLKISMNQLAMARVNLQFFQSVFSSPRVLIGVVLYALSFIIWLVVLTRMELTFAYPLLSLSVVLVAIISWFFMGETFNIYRLFGMVLTILGAWLIVKS
jgi:drug/metabolite transporter (DMT)-like permease